MVGVALFSVDNKESCSRQSRDRVRVENKRTNEMLSYEVVESLAGEKLLLYFWNVLTFVLSVSILSFIFSNVLSSFDSFVGAAQLVVAIRETSI